MSKGVYVHSTGNGYPNFMDLSSFNDKLEEIGGDGDYDIVQVWRNPRKQNNIVSSDDINQIIRIKNLELFNYLIFSIHNHQQELEN